VRTASTGESESSGSSSFIHVSFPKRCACSLTRRRWSYLLMSLVNSEHSIHTSASRVPSHVIEGISRGCLAFRQSYVAHATGHALLPTSVLHLGDDFTTHCIEADAAGPCWCVGATISFLSPGHTVHLSACARMEMVIMIVPSTDQCMLLDAQVRGKIEPLSICTPHKAKDKPST
jgi:hypothetical protein